jgi:hypothetical protein
MEARTRVCRSSSFEKSLLSYNAFENCGLLRRLLKIRYSLTTLMKDEDGQIVVFAEYAYIYLGLDYPQWLQSFGHFFTR